MIESCLDDEISNNNNKILSESSSSSSLLSLLTSSSSIINSQGMTNIGSVPVPPPPTPISISSSSSFSSQSQLTGACNMQPLIPIYHLQQSASELIQTQINNNQLDQLNVDQSINKNNTNGNSIFIDNNEWSNSLVRPATRFSIMNRRECKSTSDEPHTYEINTKNQPNYQFQNNLTLTNFDQSQACQFRTSKTAKLNLIKDELLLSANLKTKLNGGQFGFNPVKFNSNIKKLSSYNRFNTNGNHSNNSKTSVKRLSNSNHRYFIDNLNKKHSDFNHNKKLFQAVSNNDFNTVADLLESSMYDVNCFDDKQRTCLHIACSRGNLDIVRLLLEYGANPNIRDCVSNLPIHLAIISSHVPVVTLLLEAGTDIHSLDLNGKTVLHLAGTRLRWLLNDENHKASPKLKFEAIMIMNMIKEYLRRKKTSNTDLDMLANQIENAFNLDDINNLTKELLNQFETFNLNQISNNNDNVINPSNTHNSNSNLNTYNSNSQSANINNNNNTNNDTFKTNFLFK